jgi:transposase
VDAQQRLMAREQLTRPLWKALQVWLKLERGRVLDGDGIAGAIDYSLNSWVALPRHLEDGAVRIDNDFIVRQIKPWAMGRRAWLFCGSELAGQRAAIVMSLVQSALCRTRHKADYAERRTMPSGLVFRSSQPVIGSA